MTTINLGPIVNYFSGLTLGKGYAHVGVLLAFVSFTGGGEGGLITQYVGVAQEYVDRAFYFAVALIVGGTPLHIWQKSVESKERRENRNRTRSLVSSLSIELARTLPSEGMTLQEITDVLAPHPHDASKTLDQALGSLNRSRIREAAKDGQEAFEHNGRYYPRNDQTIMG